VSPEERPQDTQHPADGDTPGSTAQQRGEGPDLEKGGAEARMSPGGPTPDTNQPKAEPIPQGGGQDAAKTIGTANPHSPRIPPEASGGARTSVSGAATGSPSGGGSASAGQAEAGSGTTPGGGMSIDSGATSGGNAPHDAERPDPASEGESYRARGSLGRSPDPVESDTATGAIRTQPGVPPDSAPPAEPTPGDGAGVSVPNTEPLEGSSEESAPVRGVRTPVPSDQGTQVASADGQGVSGAHRASAPDGEVSPQ
jgi:hypothetical protein